MWTSEKKGMFLATNSFGFLIAKREEAFLYRLLSIQIDSGKKYSIQMKANI
jgi:hypothetical protein